MYLVFPTYQNRGSGLPFYYFSPSGPAQRNQIESTLIGKEPRADLTPY